MNAASFPVNSQGWSAGYAFNAPSAVFSSTLPGQRGVPSMSMVDWSKSSNTGNSFFTQGRVNVQVQIRPVTGKKDECNDWHRQLYRQPVFAYIPEEERQYIEKKQFLLRDRCELLAKTNKEGLDHSIYNASFFNNQMINEEGAPIVTPMTVSQINYKLHVDANNGIEWKIKAVKTMFPFLGIAITPDHTMEPYNGDGVLHTVIQRSGLNDVYNIWMDVAKYKYPRKGDNCYIVVRPVPNEKRTYGLELSFTKKETVEGHGNPGKLSKEWRWEFFPVFTTDGLDPHPKEFCREFGNETIMGDYYHIGRVDEVLPVQNALDGGNLDVPTDLHINVVNLVRSRTGLVMNLTARRNPVLHF